MGDAVSHIPTCAAAPMEMMENRLLGLRAALRIRGAGYGCIGGSRRYEPDAEFGRRLAWEEDGTGVVGGRADNCPVQGSSVVRLGKMRLGRLIIQALLRVRAALGMGAPYRDSLRVRNRGILGALG